MTSIHDTNAERSEIDGSPTAPVAAFPPLAQRFVLELLSEIFLLCLSDDDMPRVRSTEAPFNVSHVCRSWRSAALSTRRLWSRSHVACKDDISVLEHNIPALLEWLKRSGSIGLDLKIEFLRKPAFGAKDAIPHLPDLGRTDVSCVVAEVVLSEVANHTARLKGVSLVLPETHCAVGMRFIKRLTSLSKLRLRLYGAPVGGHERVLDGSYSHILQQLTELEISEPGGRHAGSYIITNTFPSCTMLRKLSITSFVGPGAFIQLLKNCPVLEELRLLNRWIPGWPHPADVLANIAPKTFAPLRVLELHVVDVRDFVGTFFDRLRFPGLVELSIIFSEPDVMMGIGFPRLIAFLTQSNPPLQSLRLKNDHLSQVELIQVLKLLPVLKLLRACIVEPVAHALTLPARVPETPDAVDVLCPLLEEIVFELPPLNFKDAPALWAAADDMIHSRCKSSKDRVALRGVHNTQSAKAPPKTLRRVVLPSTDVKRHPLYKSIKDCVKRGLLVVGEGIEPL